MAAEKPWADGPFELIPSSRLGYKKGDKVKAVHNMAVEMVVVHNAILRGINSIYLQCVNVESSPSPADVPAFVRYARWWGELVHHHHAAEEMIVFPDIARITGELDIMGDNIAQHRLFHAKLDEMSEYLGGVERGEAKYDGEKLRAIIDSFMPVLRQHLDDEIATLRQLEKYADKTDWAKWWAKVQALIIEKTKTPEVKTTSLPLIVVCHEKAFDGGIYDHWPPFPWLLWLLLKWLWYPKHTDSWKFAPCNINCKRQELPFA